MYYYLLNNIITPRYLKSECFLKMKDERWIDQRGHWSSKKKKKQNIQVDAVSSHCKVKSKECSSVKIIHFCIVLNFGRKINASNHNFNDFLLFIDQSCKTKIPKKCEGWILSSCKLNIFGYKNKQHENSVGLRKMN